MRYDPASEVTIMTALWMLTTLTALAGGPMLDVTGSCPGPITFDVMGLTPGTRIAVLAGAPGSDTLPGGPCADTRTDLSSVRLLSTVPDWDRDGQISLAPFVPGGACGRTVQVIDLTTCLLTNTEVLGAVDVEVDLDLTPGDGGVVAGDDPYWADKGYVFTADTTFDIAGGSWQINMPADGFVRMSVYEWPELGLIARGTATYGSGGGGVAALGPRLHLRRRRGVPRHLLHQPGELLGLYPQGQPLL